MSMRVPFMPQVPPWMLQDSGRAALPSMVTQAPQTPALGPKGVSAARLLMASGEAKLPTIPGDVGTYDRGSNVFRDLGGINPGVTPDTPINPLPTNNAPLGFWPAGHVPHEGMDYVDSPALDDPDPFTPNVPGIAGFYGPIANEHWLGGRIVGKDPTTGKPIYDPLGQGSMSDLQAGNYNTANAGHSGGGLAGLGLAHNGMGTNRFLF